MKARAKLVFRGRAGGEGQGLTRPALRAMAGGPVKRSTASSPVGSNGKPRALGSCGIAFNPLAPDPEATMRNYAPTDLV